ncbi:hypothetical protein ACFQBY_18235 [Promicromonospora citrea]|uniref:Uncharacterized protein n=1 Tax=Promicromonospora citrea TaxID=43677 RepID=A0A8H9L4Z7_9MICO|nr:hypothetical protein [Promicromonospora citrea]NNH51397.1 hypothetical protein [Promicromonospora citrea]GGM23020.1 hypothetical protein GCM10010102_18440 [Promicromonospora citrea]
MSTPWHPDLKVDLVPGQPASKPMHVVSVCWWIGCVTFAPVCIGFFAGYGEPAPAWWLLTFLVFGGSLVAGRIALGVAQRPVSRERAAGYTTIAPNIDDADYVDAVSRRIVRQRTEPHIDRREIRRRLALVRESARRDRRVAPDYW